jgi:hypothetical protein
MSNSANSNKQAARRNFYKWHRTLGLIALVPIICWTISGLSHPFMSNWFRPFIAEETFQPMPQSAMKPKLSLQQVMDQQHIGSLRNFSLINFNHHTYYQLLARDSTYRYYSADDGKLLPDADRSYAIYLARYFTQDSISSIKAITLQRNFDSHYQPINHLLPVWKVSLNRPDGMDVYVETGQSRMGTFNNHTRKFLLWFFEQLHTWDFLAAIAGDTVRNTVLLCIVSILFLSMLSGIIVYGLCWKRFKEIAKKNKVQRKNDKRFINRYHRQLGICVSILMLLFFTSAGFHLAVKLHNDQPEKAPFSQLINRNELQSDNLHLPVADSLIQKQDLARFNGKVYYQLMTVRKEMIYVDATNGQTLPNGDAIYAQYLANYYRGQSDGKANISPVKQFTEEYGFINKRLPVELVSYPGNDNWYVEPSTAKLAAHIAGIDRLEGFAFIFLHKFFWMTWAGKDIRDLVSMFSALSVLAVALLGFAAFLKNK